MAPPTWMVRGACQVCAAPITGNRFYCDDHKDENTRPPRSDWHNQPPAQPTKIDLGAELDDDAPGNEVAPKSPYDAPPAAERAAKRWKLWKAKPKNVTKPTKERAPRPTYRGKRISAATDASEVYGQIGGRLAQGPLYPSGRMMQYQAQGAGIIIDKALEGTILDRLLAQPLLRQKDRFEPVMDLAMPPVLMAMMQRARINGNQAAFDSMGSMLEYSIERNLISLLPAIREARARQTLLDAEIAETFPELAGVTDGEGRPVRPARVIIEEMFANPPGTTGPAPEAPNGESA